MKVSSKKGRLKTLNEEEGKPGVVNQASAGVVSTGVVSMGGVLLHLSAIPKNSLKDKK